jgi:hypothetical protein
MLQLSPRLKNAGIIYLSLAIMLTYYHAQTIDRKFWVERSEFHQGIIRGDFKSPYQYRILAPWMAEAGGWAVERVFGLEKVKPSAMAREAFYALQRILSIFLLFIFFHLFLRKWFSEEMSLAGTLLLAGLHLYTYRSYYYQPDSPLNILFLTIALYLFTRGEYKGWLYPLAVLGSFNRETFGLIVPLHLAYFGFKKETLKHTVGLFLTWLTVQLLLRGMFGIRPPFPDTRSISQNFNEIGWAVFLFSLMWVIPLIYFRRLPLFFRLALVLFAPPLILANFLFGKVEETRLFLDLAIVIIPCTLFALFGPEENKAPEPDWVSES